MEEGPSLPDTLLQARDEGRVVFFCGAGVSQARAGKPDFFGLAKCVMRELGAADNSDASKVLQKSREVGEDLDITGLISADRVFSLLERDFTTLNIQSAVAKSLAPAANVDRSAHEILLRLARTPSGKMQLVTTNFDRLFESGSQKLQTFQPPRLPRPSRYDDLDGIVYLHGRVNPGYTQAESDDFVLSSSDFGHAYLSEGWATEFFREIVQKYVVVFVGYSADDPLVHYLLEGLRRNSDSFHGIYAFQPEGAAELAARWQQRGVKAIAYSDADRHRALWEMLELWAIRADDPQAWRQSVLKRALVGPRTLKPHERGQVAHVVSTYEGAKAFSEVSPPAEWLCVFDPQCRFERPRKMDHFNPDSPVIDPFELYGLDFDEIPQRSGNDSFIHRREVPGDAWDAFAINALDHQDLSSHNLPAVRGNSPLNFPELPARLSCFGTWIASVADQPAAVWWAVRQEILHPSYRRSIEWRLSGNHEGIDEGIRRIWNYVLEAWNNTPEGGRQDWYDLKQNLERDGWSLEAVRRFVKLSEPYFTVVPSMIACSVPPALGDNYRITNLAQIEVNCPVPPSDAEIPDEWLYQTVRGLRICLEAAVRLCEEVNDHRHHNISPIEADERPDISDYQRTHDLSGCVITFASLYKKLVAVDRQRARDEFAAWPSDEDTAFARLRFWASAKPEVATPEEFAQEVLGMSDNVFWNCYHQRDLLIVLANRWPEMADEFRHRIEGRILAGPSRHEREEDDSYRRDAALSVMERLQWLKTHGCEFSCDVDKEIASRISDAPNWTSHYAERAADSREIRIGTVITDIEHDALIREPIDSILSKALELSGRSDTELYTEKDPFAGLSSKHPRRAYLALARAARRNKCPEWAWRKFLNSDFRAKDTSAFSAVIATRLCRLSNATLAKLLYPVTWWLQNVSKAVSSDFPNVFDVTVQRLVDVIEMSAELASTPKLGSNRGLDWVAEAINSPVGHLVRTVLNDDRLNNADAIRTRLGLIEQCLGLPDDARRHAIALASHHLAWLYANAADWAEQNLIALLDKSDIEDQEAFWSGFFWNPRVSSQTMYLRIKNGLLRYAKDEARSREGHMQSLAQLLLTGWVSSADNEDHRWLENSELKDVLLHGGDQLRSHVLWLFKDRLGNKDAESREEWQKRARGFFIEVWPKQRSVKTALMTARILEVLVANSDGFGELFDIVLPLLTNIPDASVLRIQFRGEVKRIIEAHPDRFLHLLHIVLPCDAHYWSYGVCEALDTIGEADGCLLTDFRFCELRRRWDVR
jgi:hypothetical protein